MPEQSLYAQKESDAVLIAGRVGIILLYIAIYLKDFLSQWIESTYLVGALGAGLALCILSSSLKNESDKRLGYIYITFAILAVFFSIVFNGYVNSSSYYLSIICGYALFYTDYKLFTKIIFIHVLVSAIISGYEYTTGSYLFVYQASDGTLLDEKLFGGLSDIFRAKGLFQGPLSAVAVAIWVALIFPESIIANGILMATAVFASGRLGMLVSSILMLSKIYGKRKININVIAFIAVILFSASSLISLASENQLEFISNAFNIESDQNSSRIYLWSNALKLFSSYDWNEALFGNFGSILKDEGSTENDFLRIILDCGFMGIFIYVSSYILILRKSISVGPKHFIISLVVLMCMNIFPFIQSLSSSTIYWVYLFSLTSRNSAISDQIGASRTEAAISAAV